MQARPGRVAESWVAYGWALAPDHCAWDARSSLRWVSTLQALMLDGME